MRLRSIFSLLIAVVPVVSFAQDGTMSGANPLTGTARGFYSMVSGSVVRAAEKMPEADYSFKPTPDVRSFGQIVGHVADAQYGMCSAAVGEESPVKGIEKSKTSKADLVQAVKDSVEYCKKAYSGMTDAQASQTVKFFGHDLPKLTVFSINTAHMDEHYGNMVTYLRLKSIVPPSSEERK